MNLQVLIPPTMPVGKAVRLFPATVAVFRRFGIDACCGGDTSIAKAAERDGADAVALLGALNRAAESQG